MDKYSVSIAALDEAEGLMRQFVKDAAKLCADVEEAVNGLHVEWSGEGSSAHAQSHKLWESGASDMRKAMTTLETVVRQANSNYSTAFSTNIGMWPR